MKAIWFLVLINFSSWDGRLLQVHKVASFNTEKACIEAQKNMRVSDTMRAICTNSPIADWNENK